MGDVVRIEYDLDGNGVVDSTSNDIGLFRFKWDDKTGVFNVIITAIDNDSNRASEIMVLSVYEDKPIAKAGNDQVIKRDSEIKLSAAESTDGYGEIIEFQWEYSINSDSHVIASESPDTGITLPKDFLGDIPVVLTVTDDDGLIGKDTVNIAVKLFFKVLTDAGPFAKRIYGQSIVFKDTLWIFGGKGTSVATLTPPHNDIWYSTDGENWNSDQFDSTFKPRYLHTVCEFNDKLWIIGGLSDNSQGYLNDAWSSSDGLNWELVTDSANFSARARHASVVYDDKIWVIGGLTGYWDSDTSYNNDVWSSVDGMNWVLESTGQFPGSGSHKVQAFNDHLFLFGTGHEFIGTGHVNGSLSGTYQSTDGKTWTQINDFQINSEFNMIPFLNTLWVVAGDVRSNNNMYQLNSELNWIKYDAYDLDYSNATGSSFAVFNDKIILMGGSIGGAGGGPVHGTNMIAIFE